MALTTKPRWDKYDGYVGNYRGVLGVDIDLETESNKVLAVGHNSDGAIVVGSGQTGIKGVMIVAVGADIHGNYLDGGINNMTGDVQDVGKHGEITNFVPSDLTNDFTLTVVVGSGSFTAKVKNAVTGVSQAIAGVAFNAANSAVKTAIVAVDDSLLAASVTVTGTAPNFVVTLPDDYVLEANDASATVTTAPATLAAAAGTNYYGHADGSVTATKGSDGVYVGHTVEASRLIVNVLDATP
jgi:hypothetical protein